MSKNIEINYKNDAGYEELYPKTKTDINYLSPAINTLYGFTGESSLDDALAQLFLGVGKYGYAIHVEYPDGSPAEGFTVMGLNALDGSPAVTNENGDVLGVSTETSVSVSVTSPYFDLDSASQTVQSTGIITSATVQMAVKYAENQAVTLRTSQTVQFSPAVAEVDFCAVGGGGGAGGPTTYFGSGGGAGGYAVNLLNQIPAPGDTYVFTIGAGGRGGGAGFRPGDSSGTYYGGEGADGAVILRMRYVS